MQPKHFEGQNIVFGENQPEYTPLPAHKQEDGTVTMCIELTEEDKKIVAENGVIWIQLLTFNQPLQPLRFLSEKPELPVNEKLEAQIKAFKQFQLDEEQRKQTRGAKLKRLEQNAKLRKENPGQNNLKKC